MKSWQRQGATLADDEDDQRDVNVAANNHCISLRLKPTNIICRYLRTVGFMVVNVVIAIITIGSWVHNIL
jgi:hypothetical protein